MVPFDQLEQREQDKDAVFIALCEIARQWIGTGGAMTSGQQSGYPAKADPSVEPSRANLDAVPDEGLKVCSQDGGDQAEREHIQLGIAPPERRRANRARQGGARRGAALEPR